MASVVLHSGDCLEMLPGLTGVDAVVADPPYGMKYRSTHASVVSGTEWDKYRRRSNFAPIEGDDVPFDPSPWLRYPLVALFGANFFADLLPPSRAWVVWDKRRDSTPDSHSDCELIWTNTKKVTRVHRQLWRGIVREGEENTSRQPKHHPNQKPVALMMFLFNYLGLKPGQTVFDPYMGSGSTGVAAIRSGLNFIGAEIDPVYFAISKKRIQSEQSKTPLLDAIESAATNGQARCI